MKQARGRQGAPISRTESEMAAEPTTVDYEKASADLKRYLPLKVATFLWFMAVFGVAVYTIGATWNEWWPYTVLGIADLEEARPAIYSFVSGLLGATVYSLRGFYWAVGPQSRTNPRYQYDPNWTLWYIARPIMGAFLGTFTFALLRAGVATLGTASTDATATAAYFAVAFLAGFAVTEVLNWFNAAARRVFQTPETGGASPGQQQRAEEEPRKNAQG